MERAEPTDAALGILLGTASEHQIEVHTAFEAQAQDGVLDSSFLHKRQEQCTCVYLTQSSKCSPIGIWWGGTHSARTCRQLPKPTTHT